MFDRVPDNHGTQRLSLDQATKCSGDRTYVKCTTLGVLPAKSDSLIAQSIHHLWPFLDVTKRAQRPNASLPCVAGFRGKPRCLQE